LLLKLQASSKQKDTGRATVNMVPPTVSNANGKAEHSNKRQRLPSPSPTVASTVADTIDAEEHRQSLTMATPAVSDASYSAEHRNKRQRLSPPYSDSASNVNQSGEASLNTRPSSTPPEIMSLRLIIPQPQPAKGDQRALANREAAAKRWVPKLQRPFPKRKEISEAYNLKLMRHYPGPVTSPIIHTNTSTMTASATSMEPNFIKPHINVSPRVTNLLKRFPKVYTSDFDVHASTPSYASIASTAPTEIVYTGKDNMLLRENKRITSHKFGQRLAWHCFSATERDRIDRGREAMMVSGLAQDDLAKEKKGLHNGLPEWRKERTGKFALEDKIQRWRMNI
jgi:hypothetical protein